MGKLRPGDGREPTEVTQQIRGHPSTRTQISRVLAQSTFTSNIGLCEGLQAASQKDWPERKRHVWTEHARAKVRAVFRKNFHSEWRGAKPPPVWELGRERGLFQDLTLYQAFNRLPLPFNCFGGENWLLSFVWGKTVSGDFCYANRAGNPPQNGADTKAE